MHALNCTCLTLIPTSAFVRFDLHQTLNAHPIRCQNARPARRAHSTAGVCPNPEYSQPQTLKPRPGAPFTINLHLHILDPEPQTQTSKPESPNHKPETPYSNLKCARRRLLRSLLIGCPLPCRVPPHLIQINSQPILFDLIHHNPSTQHPKPQPPA